MTEKLSDLYRAGGFKVLLAVLVSGLIGLMIAVIDHFRPGFGARALRAIERRKP